MMKGFMDYLTGDSNQARELREKFIFKLVPMLNPDGVSDEIYKQFTHASSNVFSLIYIMVFFYYDR